MPFGYINSPFSERIPQEELETVLSQPPFIKLPGAFNLRALPFACPRQLYRSGDLHQYTAESARRLKEELGVTTVFDLRSEGELHRRPVPSFVAENGIEVVHCPILSNIIAGKTSTTVHALKKHAAATSPTEVFVADYAGILESGDLWIKLIFDFWAERPEESFLVNCTAGKDRTGTVCMLMNLLAGVDEETICIDYALTRYGLEDLHDFLGDLLAKQGVEGGMSQEDAERAAISLSTSYTDTMRQVIGIVNEKYGGIDRYLLEKVQLDPANLKTLKDRLSNCQKRTLQVPSLKAKS